MAEQFANQAQTTLAVGVNGALGSLTVANGAVFPAGGNFRIVVDSEIMLCTARVGAVCTVSRGQEGTAAVPHSINATVTHVLTAAVMDKVPLIDEANTFSAEQRMERSLAADIALSIRTTGGSFDRFAVDASGQVLLGSGGVAPDVNLYRAGVNVLKTDDELQAAGSIKALGATSYLYGAQGTAFEVAIGQYPGGFAGIAFGSAADTSLSRAAARVLRTNGYIQSILGAGETQGFTVLNLLLADNHVFLGMQAGTPILKFGDGSGAPDTNLYRQAANTLRTDDDFMATGSVYANRDQPDQILFDQKAGDAAIYFGSSQDTNLYRYTANGLKTDDQLWAVGGLVSEGTFYTNAIYPAASASPAIIIGQNHATTNIVLAVRGMAAQSADLQRWENNLGNGLLRVDKDGNVIVNSADNGAQLLFGAGADTNLYRHSANALKTDDEFLTNGSITIGHGSVGGANLYFGSSQDVALFRGGADILESSDHFWLDGANVQLRLGVASRQKALYSSGNDSPWDDLWFDSKGNTGGWQGSHRFRASYNDGVMADIARFGVDASSVGFLHLMNNAAKIYFGAASDVNLYRSAADVLKTDDALVVTGALTLLNSNLVGSLRIGAGSETLAVGSVAPDSTVDAYIRAGIGTNTVLAVAATAAQTGNLTEWRDVNAIKQAWMTPDGKLRLGASAANVETIEIDGAGGSDAPRMHLTNATTGRGASDGWYFGLGNGDDFNILGYEAGGDFSIYTGGNVHFILTGDNKLKFYDNATPVAKQTGVPVTAAGIHAALVNLGLIAA